MYKMYKTKLRTPIVQFLVSEFMCTASVTLDTNVIMLVTEIVHKKTTLYVCWVRFCTGRTRPTPKIYVVANLVSILNASGYALTTNITGQAKFC